MVKEVKGFELFLSRIENYFHKVAFIKLHFFFGGDYFLFLALWNVGGY